MSEEQAFWTFNVLCDKLVPGYYSTSMHGALLDQMIFENLVAKMMPILDEHLKKNGITLSIVTLPWFLTLFINSMPLHFAQRILDCFFLEGPKILFQIGLAILKINGDELLNCKEDGSFIDTLKTYFSTLDTPINPELAKKGINKFTKLIQLAYKEFSIVDMQMITEMRKSFQMKVVHNIENFARQTTIRNLKSTGKFTNQELQLLYDRFSSAIFYVNSQSSQEEEADLLNGAPLPKANQNQKMNFESFENLLEQILIGYELSPEEIEMRKLVEKPPISPRTVLGQVMFDQFQPDEDGYLDFQQVVTGFDSILNHGSEPRIKLFFDMIDDQMLGALNSDSITKFAELLLFLYRHTGSEEYLTQIPKFIKQADNAIHGGSASPTPITSPQSADLDWALSDNPFEDTIPKSQSPTNQTKSIDIEAFKTLIAKNAWLAHFFETQLVQMITFEAPSVYRLEDRGLSRQIVDTIVDQGTKVIGTVGKRLQHFIVPPNNQLTPANNANGIQSTPSQVQMLKHEELVEPATAADSLLIDDDLLGPLDSVSRKDSKGSILDDPFDEQVLSKDMEELLVDI